MGFFEKEWDVLSTGPSLSAFYRIKSLLWDNGIVYEAKTELVNGRECYTVLVRGRDLDAAQRLLPELKK